MTTRLNVFNVGYQGQLFVTDCARCGVIFAITTDLERRRREDHGTFYCPNGHDMVFTQQTEAEKLRERLERERQYKNDAYERLDAARQIAQTERRRAAAAKGQLTKMRNRVARGLCPMAGCSETFANLHDHVAAQHPELVEAVEAVDA